MKPDLIGSGIKEKYIFQKMGIPFRQMHSWDYSGPYHGYDGFAIFARDMDMTLNNPCWKQVNVPWKTAEVEKVAAVAKRSVSLGSSPLPTRAVGNELNDLSFPQYVVHRLVARRRLP